MTNKTLHLIRHAKSSWDEPALADLHRPLNKRGLKSCAIMAGPIFAAGCDFSRVYCSKARRAQMTVEGLAAALGDKKIHWEVEEALYTFSAHALLQWCRTLGDEQEHVVIVGHNPALTDLNNMLCAEHIDNMPTCAYVQLQAQIPTWSDLPGAVFVRKQFLYPKLFKDKNFPLNDLPQR